MIRNRMRGIGILIMAMTVTALTIPTVCAQRGPGFGRGFQGGRGGGQGFRGGRGAAEQNHAEDRGGHDHDDRHDEDRDDFHFLLSNHTKISRTVKEIEGGVETITESREPEIAEKIKEHVEWMKYRVENANPIRMRDPLFAEIFKHTDKIVMKVEETKHGVKVRETSEDAYVAGLIRQHAEVVSGFVANGFDEAMRNHPVSSAGRESVGTSMETFEKQFPVIAGYGGVVPLPEAAHQPENGSRVVIDLTGGGDPGKIYPSLDKVARYVNLYGGGGKKSAQADMVVVLHGDATLAALEPDAYARKLSMDQNPNLECMRELHKAGVEFVVCGQSLIAKGAEPSDVVPFVDVAVSAMTALVNLQRDGHAYIPLK